jgi:16S rRNA (cytidine1402-2'-O)-methyltransferase
VAQGRLYIVATPIGNRADWSPRAIDILRGVDLVAAEDTRHSGTLLKHAGIDAHFVSYHEHNETERAAELVAELQAGKTVALITDAGTPCISDPGYRLVRQAREAGVEVVPVPGPSAAIAALSVSGLPSDTFTFHGFLPKKAGQLQALLERIHDQTGTHIFFESPKRVHAAVDAIGEQLPRAEIALARELTKLHEEVVSGDAEHVKAAIDGRELKGECVLVVYVPAEKVEIADEDLRQRVSGAMERDGLSQRDAIKAVAKELAVPKNRVYAVMMQNE